MWNDFRYAARVLAKSPMFALTAILTIALGIAAATAIFSVTDAVLLRPLPYKDPRNLVIVRSDMVKRNVRDFPLSNADFLDLKKETAGAFEDMTAVLTARQAFPLPDGTAEQLRIAGVTTNFFSFLGGRIVAGRDFNEADGDPGPARAPGAANNAPPPLFNAIISHEYWQRRFGGRADIFGQRLAGNQGPVIVGVVAPGFDLQFPPSADMERKPDLWLALRLDYDNAARNNVSLRAIGRLRPGVSVQQAQTQADLVAAEIRRNFSINETSGYALTVLPMQRHLVDAVRPAILALMGAVIFLLLIACANVANLLLVRASLREREYAIRTALGGGWWRLARQTVAEVLLLAASGTAIGVGLAALGLERLLALAPPNLPRLDAVGMHPSVIFFAALAGLAAAIVFGLAPVIRMMRPDVMQVLRTDGRGTGLGGGNRLRGALVVTEIALCFVLLIGSGLMFRSFLALQRVEPGFDPNGVFTASLSMDALREATPEGRAAVQERLRHALSSIPGVSGVAATFPLPLGGGFNPIRWGTEEALADPSKFQAANSQFVLPGYFETMRTRIVEGRAFNDDDNRADRKCVIIDQALALKAFGGASAIGKRILIRVVTPEPVWVDVIGVAEHVRTVSLAEKGREQIYFTDGYLGSGAASEWALRTSRDPAGLLPLMREAVAKVDPRIVLVEARSMSTLVDRAQAATRFQLFLIGTFALIAVVLAAVGLYGVLSTVVRQRTAEIGLRMALGAAPSSVFGLFVTYGLRLGAFGVALGAVAGLFLTRLMSTMLVGVQPTDPLTYCAVAIGFLLLAALAAWVPARRASSLDPMNASRDT